MSFSFFVHKEYFQGKPDCLKNLCFLRTGVLDSLETDEFEELIKKHGGRTVHSVSSKYLLLVILLYIDIKCFFFVEKVNYVVVGEEPGPAKLQKAKNYGITTISEDELLDLIRTKSGLKPIYSKPADGELEETISNDTETKKSQTKVTKTSPGSTPDKKKGMQTKVSESSSHKAMPEKIDTVLITSPKISSKTTTETVSRKPDIKKLSSTITSQKIEDEIPSTTERSVLPVKISERNNAKKPSTSKTMPPVPVNLPQKAIDVPDTNMAWTEKYKPKTTKNIIGQQGDRSNMKKLITWLTNWHLYHGGKSNVKLTKPSPWAKNDDGAYFKCALLSGPPGVGKYI